MTKRPQRPLSVWLTQAIVLVGICFGVLHLILPIWERIFWCNSPEAPPQCSFPFSPARSFGHLIGLALFLVTFWGLQRRKSYGKWLGVVVLGMIALAGTAEEHHIQLIYHSLRQWQPLPSPPYDCWQSSIAMGNVQTYCGYTSYWDLARRLLISLVPGILLIFLAVRLLLSRASQRFFQPIIKE